MVGLVLFTDWCSSGAAVTGGLVILSTVANSNQRIINVSGNDFGKEQFPCIFQSLIIFVQPVFVYLIVNLEPSFPLFSLGSLILPFFTTYQLMAIPWRLLSFRDNFNFS